MNILKKLKIDLNDKNIEKEKEKEKEHINDEELELFQNVLSKELVIELYSLFKIFEKKGLINYNIYIESMTQIFRKYNKDKSHDFKDIFDLIFNRFQKIKCIMKNDKKVFYLTNMFPQNKIETYVIVCFLTIFIKCRIFDKIKLLFELTDIDDDGFLNKYEIKLMISTINFMFCEESSLINTNSSILAQSLMNIKVKEKINKIMKDPGNLDIELQKEKYISFGTFYNSLIKIKNYKYEIIPFFVNMKQCLYNKRSEKILEIKNKYKKEFVRASSALSYERQNNPLKQFKRNFSANNLGRIIRNVKINNDINSLKVFNKKKLLSGTKEKTKSFRELLKESTILSDDEIDEGEGTLHDPTKLSSFDELSTASKRIHVHNTTKKGKPLYIFEADFDKIKKIEVQPALLKFSCDNEEVKEKEKIKINKKKLLRYNSTLNSKKEFKNHNKKNFNNEIYYGTLDLNFKKNITVKTNDVLKTPVITNKRTSIFPMELKNNIFNKFYLNKEHTFNLYHNIFNNSNNNIYNNNLINLNISKDIKNQLFKHSNSTLNKNINLNNDRSSGIIKIFERHNNQKNVKRPFSSINNNINTYKRKIIEKMNKVEIKTRNKNKITETRNSKKSSLLNQFNTYKYRRRNLDKLYGRNKTKKISDSKKRLNKYLSATDIIKDVDQNEEKLKHERTEYFGKELISLYKKMLIEKKEIRKIIGKYDKYDVSLNFFDFTKKRFPQDYGKSIFSFNKYY